MDIPLIFLLSQGTKLERREEIKTTTEEVKMISTWTAWGAAAFDVAHEISRRSWGRKKEDWPHRIRS